MQAPVSTREKGIVIAFLIVLVVVFTISAYELMRSFVAPEALSGLIDGEGPSASRCAYRSLVSYRMSNALLSGLSSFAILLLLPIAAARHRLSLLVPILALTASFGFWFEWGCRLIGSAM